MKKIITISMLAAMAMTAAAQDTYTNAQMADEGLSGTARYVGMGGAMEALGADISTMQSNPAGTGMFRKSQIAVTGGMQMVGNNTIDNDNAKTTTFGLNQLGFVWVTKSGDYGNINFGINYHKSKNFNQILDTQGLLSNASQNKVSYNKYCDGDMMPGWRSESIVDQLYNSNLMWNYDEKGNILDYNDYLNANKFRYQEMTKGFISDYDFNISGNINNRLYLGMTITMRDVHYTNSSMYTENLVTGDDVVKNIAGTDYAVVYITDETRITGTGVGIKLGAIYRPIETSPFRIGAYIHTPTWYKLKKEETTYLNADIVNDLSYSDCITNSLEYDVYTPWKFGLSLGHTVGNKLAVGATYEYSKYSTMNNRVIDGGYDYYGSYESTSSDAQMNRNTKEVLQGVHTLKIGAEFRPVSQLAVRVGYNYLSAMYNNCGVRNEVYDDALNRYVTVESQGVWASGTTAYTNWNSTHRFTCGLGYTIGHVNIDLAYQYTTTKGTFYPFPPQTYAESTVVYDQNIPTATDVKDNRSQLSLTLGYRF